MSMLPVGEALEDPALERLKERSLRRPLARPGLLHLASVACVVAGAGLSIAGAFRPWIVLYGTSAAAIQRDDANAALASLIVIGAVVELAAVAVVLRDVVRHHQARLLHLVSIIFSVIGFYLLTRRLEVDNHRVYLANLDENVPTSHLGDGVWLTVGGLGLGLAAALVALPLVIRALRV